MTIANNTFQAMNGLNTFLAEGFGIGRLRSAATTHLGQVGYFCVTSVELDGCEQEAIIFVTETNGVIAVSASPGRVNLRKIWVMAQEELRRYDEHW